MRRVAAFIPRWTADHSGATAIEMAFVLPVMAMLVIGVISLSMLGSAISSMHFAVEEASRCSAVNALACGSASATVNYARSKFHGPAVTPAFVSTTTGCGHTVTATATFELFLAVYTIQIPLSATACYPGKDS